MKSRGGPGSKEEEDPSFLLAFLSAFLWLAERFDPTDPCAITTDSFAFTTPVVATIPFDTY